MVRLRLKWQKIISNFLFEGEPTGSPSFFGPTWPEVPGQDLLKSR